jgi:HK97 family phage portal protein
MSRLSDAWNALLGRTEVRSLENPATPIGAHSLAELLGAMPSTPSGARVSAETAIQFWAVSACIRVIAETIATLPLHVYKRDGEQDVIAYDHPLYSVLHDRPNSMLTSYAFHEALTAQAALYGNGYAAILTEAGRQSLMLTPPGAVTSEVRRVGLVYRLKFRDGWEELPASEIIHLPGLTLDGFTGMSTALKLARDLVGEAMATAEHSARFFSNGARVGGVLSTEQVLKDDAIARIRTQWQQTQGGTANAYRTAILEQGLKYQPTGMQSDNAQLVESREMQAEQVAGVFRVPPLFIGLYRRMTYANAEHNDIHFAKHCITPWCRKLEQEYRVKLFASDPKHRAEFNLAGLMRGDFKTQIESLTKGVQGGIYTPNEARGFLNLPKAEGGDKLFIQQNMADLTNLPDPNAKPPAPKFDA